MRLITAHRILIGAAIAFFLLYAALQLRHGLASEGGAALVQAVVSLTIAVALVVYYRSLRRRWPTPPPHDEQRR
jgi:membrane protein implicated in regulation of membrane protease activity